ncbi:MAG: hypothetical protein JW735_01315 [Prolixibacteraceae bacterium]|nr:hypothetical protein [Prolixibacteraceae bacterium]
MKTMHGTIFLLIILTVLSACTVKSSQTNTANKPLYRDPVYDGAADPLVIWNNEEEKWFMYYTNRRANIENSVGVDWVHGTRIGIAQSDDGGATWQYRDTCNINYRPDTAYTHWAPEVIEHNGLYHMYLTYVPGIFTDWRHPRHIIHLSSKNGIDWDFESQLNLASEKVIDACVVQMPDGNWRMWYNNEAEGKTMYYADSPDLYNWTDKGWADGKFRGEGAKVFKWQNTWWMLIDEWKGLAVYQSDDLEIWNRQPGNILQEPGTGEDDMVIGGHPDVVVQGKRAFVFYFTHPGRRPEIPDSPAYEKRRSSIQLTELFYEEGNIACYRNKPVNIDL